MSEKNIAKGVVWAYVTNHPLLFWNYKKCTSNWQRATDFFQRYLNIHSIELRQFQQKRLMFWGISQNIYVGGSYLYISATEFIKKKKASIMICRSTLVTENFDLDSVSLLLENALKILGTFFGIQTKAFS